MITHVSLVTVWVTDQDEAKRFYVDVLGFVEHTDATMGPDFRWVTVCHPAHPELEVTLMTPARRWTRAWPRRSAGRSRPAR